MNRKPPYYLMTSFLLILFTSAAAANDGNGKQNRAEKRISGNPITFTQPITEEWSSCEFESIEDQAQLDSSIISWVNMNQQLLNPMNGCSEIIVTNNYDNRILDICAGGELEVTWTLQDTCEAITTSASFILNPPAPLTYTEPFNVTLSNCNSADIEFEILSYYTASRALLENTIGGCNAFITDDFVAPEPLSCEFFSLTIIWTLENKCETISFVSTIELLPYDFTLDDYPPDLTLSCADAQTYDYFGQSPSVITFGPCQDEPLITYFVDGDLENCDEEVTIVWSATDHCGNSSAYGQKVFITDDCSGGDTPIIGSTRICEGSSTVLLVESGLSSYLWNTGDTTHTITVSQGGTYSVALTNDEGCTKIEWIDIEMIPSPNPEINLECNINCNSTLKVEGQFENYQWSTGETSTMIQVSDAGYYFLTVTSIDGCTGTAEFLYALTVFDTVYVFDTTYVEVVETIYDTVLISVTDTLIIELETSNTNNVVNGKLKIYPNPSNNLVNIELAEFLSFSEYKLNIINELGILIYSNKIQQKLLQIPIHEIGPAGNYFIQIFDENENLHQIKSLILVE